MLKNKVIYVLDTSYSMNMLRESALNVFNTILETNKKANEKAKQRTEISVATFDDPNAFKYVYRDINSKKVEKLKLSQYVTSGGSTALIDAVGEAITDALEGPDADDDETSFLLIIVTDGGENNSKSFTRSDLSRLISKVQRTDRWTITFQVPYGGKSVLVNLGIPSENIREWDVSERGIKEVEEKTSGGIMSFYNSRSRGLKSVSNFYVETDLSNITPRQLKKELDDLSSRYGIFTSPKEGQIRDFVESKTKRPYRKGQAFYQLVKAETIQADKEILILDKNTTAIYGGEEARELIGLPLNQNAKVHPGDHANYDVFVQSNSVNRKLLKGNKVAIEMV